MDDRICIGGDGGGLHFLLTMPDRSEEELYAQAADKGIRLHRLSDSPTYFRRAHPLLCWATAACQMIRSKHRWSCCALRGDSDAEMRIRFL